MQIPKGRNNNLSDSSNFRGIALSPVYGKIYDNIVLSQHTDTLMSSELQFGFEAHRSTNMHEHNDFKGNYGVLQLEPQLSVLFFLRRN